MDECEDLADMGDVLFKGIRVDKDVVKINNTEKVKVFTQTVVGVSLYRCRSVGETEGGNQIFEVTVMHSKCCVLFIAECDAQLIKGIAQIQLRLVFRVWIRSMSSEINGKGQRVLTVMVLDLR